ncbi:hypothetical protein M8C21_014999, partial [Ambrosia artemisiifolia]
AFDLSNLLPRITSTTTTDLTFQLASQARIGRLSGGICCGASGCVRSKDDEESWGFFRAMFEDDGTARTKLLNHLSVTLPAE